MCFVWPPSLIATPPSTTMDNRNIDNILALVGFSLCSVLISAEPVSSCPGPRKYYEEIGCTPIFSNPDSKCPVRYDCDNLKDLPADKCFVNGHVYEIGDPLRNEDRNPCDVDCFCSRSTKGPKFNCALVQCSNGPTTPGCYREHLPQNCCSSPEVCLENPEDRPICVVDGKTFRDGEYFRPETEPNKHCYCGPGYIGQNVEPYCISSKIGECGTLLHNIDDIRENCVPVYDFDQSPETSCSSSSRCQGENDVVIAPTSDRSTIADPDMLCRLGNLTMRVNDKLNDIMDENSECIKCVCEVPPVPTCRRLSDEECEIVKNYIR